MEHRILLAMATVLVLCQNAYALTCYKCHSIKPNSTECYDPIDRTKIQAIECGSTNTKLDDGIMRAHIDRDVLEKAENASEYVCVQYEQSLSGIEGSEIVRSCHPKISNVDFCQMKNETLQMESKKLHNCNVCQSNHCNGPVPSENGEDPDSAAGLSISLFISIVTLILSVLVR